MRKWFFILSFLITTVCYGQQDTLYLQQNGTVALPDYFTKVVVSDNCGIDYMVQSPSAGFIVTSNMSVVNVMLRARDMFNNENSVSFNVIIIDTFDIHVIDTVVIGNQVWMARNLDVSTMSDGTPIPHVIDNGEWISIQAPAYSWYNNDSITYGEYGKLYNYYAINSGKLCPAGWRVPTKQDWEQLVAYLDPTANFVRHEASTIAGGMLREAGTEHWWNNIPCTNETGFTALPAGCRAYAGTFSMGNAFGYFGGTPNGYSVALRFATNSIFMRDGISTYVGLSIRCIKE